MPLHLKLNSLCLEERAGLVFLKNKYDFLLNMTLKLFKLLNCLGAPEEP